MPKQPKQRKQRRQQGEKLLNWGFVLALSLHAAALAGAACMPTQVGRQDLTDIRVFDTGAADSVTPVELVELADGEARFKIRDSRVEAMAASREARAEIPEPRVASREVRRSPVARPEGRGYEGQGSRNSTRPIPSVEPRNPAVMPGGGGGGGAVELGTPSANGELVGVGTGGTPMGEVPGSGTGSGTGTGPGSSGGSGGGSGGGTGTGQGTGAGQGSGSGTGGEGENGSGFASRVADRAEPAVTHKGTLEYPRGAAEDGVEGTVRLKVLVTEAGTVAEVTVAQSSGDKRLDAAAAEFAKGWRYKPAVQDGKARRVYTHAVVKFELQ